MAVRMLQTSSEASDREYSSDQAALRHGARGQRHPQHQGQPAARELLKNFRLRKDLGLLPVHGESRESLQHDPLEEETQQWLSSSRRAALLAHEAYGYSARKPRFPRPILQPRLPSRAAAGEPMPAAAKALAADDEASEETASEPAQDSGEIELEERCAALESQLQDLEVQLVACRLSAAETVESIVARQREMGSVVDEHAALSRRISDARGRNDELKNEALRLQSALASLCTVVPPADLDSDDDDRPMGVTTEVAAASGTAASDTDADTRAECDSLRRKLNLHRAHLARLEAENRELRSSCPLSESYSH